MPVSHHINYVELPSRDLSATRTFFSEVFGWRFTDYGPDYTAFSNSGMEGGFFRAGLPSLTQNGAALVVLYSDNLEAIQDRIIQAGGTIVEPIFTFPGGRRFHFVEPGGSELAVWSALTEGPH